MSKRYTDIKDPDGEMPALVPRIGVIGLGVKKLSQGGKEYPAEVPYFVLDDPSAHCIVDAYLSNEWVKPDVGAAWKKGTAGPSSIPIMLVSDDPAEVAPVSMEAWGKGVCLCRGNGEEAQRLRFDGDKAIGYVAHECPCDWFTSTPPKCRRQLRLYVMLPHVAVAGCFQISSNSRTTVGRIRADIAYVRMLFGRVCGLMNGATGAPLLELRREKWQSSKDKREHYAVRIVPRKGVDMKQLADYRREFAGLPAPQKRIDAPRPEHDYPRSAGNDTYSDGTTAPTIAKETGANNVPDPSSERAREWARCAEQETEPLEGEDAATQQWNDVSAGIEAAKAMGGQTIAAPAPKPSAPKFTKGATK